MNNIFSHFSKVDNAGDLYCCPLNYFEFENSEKINFLDLHLSQNHSITLPNLVFGGGGMLHDIFIDILERFPKHPNKRKLIFWGAGINEHDINKQYFPAFLNKFDLVGLRDFSNPWDYVPCVSCMSEAFNNIKEPITDFILYEHSDNSILINCEYKRNNSLKKDENLSSIISFLSQGESIITNSYHGAYWGLLMNRKVLIYEPFSNRFCGFKYQPVFCNKDNWKSKLQINIKIASNYLEECRKINMQYYDKVKNLLV